MRVLVLSSLLLAGAASPLAAVEIYQAPSPEPTPEETLALELMNRLRADPQGEASRILATKPKRGGIDWDMFEREMAELKPRPPLVFDLALLRAARRHSFYMIHHGLGHDEQPGRIGFTGASPGERMKAAGFAGNGSAENAYRDAPSPEGGHVGFVVDWGEGPGGMQPGRGHRRNMMGGGDVVGIGIVPHDGRGSTTHNFGSLGRRFVGGVVFVDRDGDGCYDVGEGRGGVLIASADGKARTRTWASGAYALELRSSGPVQIGALWHGRKHHVSFAAGGDNVKFDWAMPPELDAELVDAAIAELEAVGDDAGQARKRFAVAVDLLLLVDELQFDDVRCARVRELCADARAQFDQHRQAVRAAMAADDDAALRSALGEGGRAFRGTAAADWFDGAAALAKAGGAVAGLERMLEAGQQVKRRDAEQLTAALTVAVQEQEHADLRADFAALSERVQAALARLR